MRDRASLAVPPPRPGRSGDLVRVEAIRAVDGHDRLGAKKRHGERPERESARAVPEDPGHLPRGRGKTEGGGALHVERGHGRPYNFR